MFTPPDPLGVGCSLFPTAPHVIGQLHDLIDFVELGPDGLSQQVLDTDGATRLVFLPHVLEHALRAIDTKPVVVHGVELSIGTADGWNSAYIEILDRFHDLRQFAWHSEHLGYMLARHQNGQTFHSGVPLPLPFTQEALDCVVPRVNQLSRRYGVPFLLENAVWYLPDLPRDPGWDEITFLNHLVEQSDGGLLLDLFNLYCNSVNLGFDLLQALERLRLDRVVEIHLAGGRPEAGFLLDSHSDRVPQPVWDALEWILPRASNVAGLVYEVLEQAFAPLGVQVMRDELEHARQVWRRYRT
jgi:uncharacterized protein (UPF0276 family)